MSADISVRGGIVACAALALILPSVAAQAETDDERDTSLVIERQELEIAPERVHASYVFRNPGGAELTATITLPIETFVAEDDGDKEVASAWERATVYVDGSPRKVELRIRRDGNTMRISYRWKQTIAGNGKITVEHEYDPGGQLTLPRGEGSAEAWDQLTSDYCIDKPTQRWGRAARRQGQRVHHLLAGASAAAGTIGQFRLTVKKAKPSQRLSACLPGLRKTDATTMRLERTLYSPQTDLKLLYLD